MTVLLINIYDHGHGVAISDINPLNAHTRCEMLTTNKQPVSVCGDVSNEFLRKGGAERKWASPALDDWGNVAHEVMDTSVGTICHDSALLTRVLKINESH